MVLTNDGKLQARIADPKFKLEKTYWVQVEGIPDDQAIEHLKQGVVLKDGPTLPARARKIAAPELWQRNPPIRYRAAIPTQWLEISLQEGRNRQIRRMTACVGHPTLRLVRIAMGQWKLKQLQPGEWLTVDRKPAPQRERRKRPLSAR